MNHFLEEMNITLHLRGKRSISIDIDEVLAFLYSSDQVNAFANLS